MPLRKAPLFVTLMLVVGCTARYIRPTTDEKVERTFERVKRGEYLVKVVGACGVCHDGRTSGELDAPGDPALHLAGGNTLRDGAFAIWIPNITNDPETGLGRWSDDEIIRAIRDGVKPDGSFLFPAMPFGAYQHLSDEDVRSIVAYLRSVPAQQPVKPRQANKVPFPVGMMLGMGVAMHDPVKSVPEPDRSNAVAYGEYLAHVAHCTECHSMGAKGPRGKNDRWMAGGDTPMELPGVGKVWAANLTPDKETGLGGITSEQLKLSLMSGVRKDGKRMAPPMSMYIPHLAQYEPADLDALAAYLQSLPPVKNKVQERQLIKQFAQQMGE